MSKNIDTTDTVVLARLPSSLFGHRIGGVVIHKPYMLTSVDDGSIWVWNMATMEVERKLLANTAPNVWVRPLLLTEMYDKKSKTKRLKLVSGWADGAIRVFDMRTWELEETLVAHNGPVLCLDASDGRLLRSVLALYSLVQPLLQSRAASLSPATCVQDCMLTRTPSTLFPHTHALCSLASQARPRLSSLRRIPSALFPYMHTLGSLSVVGCSLRVVNFVLVCTVLLCTLLFFNALHFYVLKTPCASNSTGSDMSVYEWSTDDWKIKRVLRGHRGAVCAVTGNDGQTITASLDGFIKVWEKLQ